MMKDIQQHFLQRIEQKLAGTLLVRELMDILEISKSEAYHKISGKSLLTTTQITSLCQRFEINFTIPGFKQHHLSEVSFTPFRHQSGTVSTYLESLEKLLLSIASANHKLLSCATDDIPIFHLFGYPELSAFKLHFWQLRATDNAPFLFDFSRWDDALLNITRALHETYKTIPSVEVWTKSSLLSTLEQIKYAKENGIITGNAMGRLICNQLRSALQDIEGYAIHKQKPAADSPLFDWYFYEIIGSITYLAETDGNLMMFLRFNTFNTLQAYNQPVCEEVKHWLHKLVADSTGFSGQGSLHRNRYLAKAYAACDELEQSFA